MKILLLSYKFSPEIGGIESHSMMLMKNFVRLGHDVVVLTTTVQKSELDNSYKIIREHNVLNLLWYIKWADIVFENNPCYRLSWPCIFIKKPHVINLHTWIESKNQKIGLKEKIKIHLLGFADVVVACSNAIREKCYINSIVIENPYDNHIFTNISSITRSKDFVFLGRLVSDKGVDMAIDAIVKINQAKICEDIYHLSIIGDGEERQNLEKHVEFLNATEYIHFKGSIKGQALAEELNKYKYILIPSRWEEPFGIVALEGIACGCIPIVSNGGGLPDAVGDAGVVFERNSIDSFVHSILSLLSNDELICQLKEKSQKHLLYHQSEYIIMKYIHLLEKLNNQNL